ncbi:MAG: ABC transporter permease, partial [Acidobacteriota bacterium]
VLSLAVGIGANVAIFSVINAILLRERPLQKPEEVVEIYLSQPDFQYGTLSYPDYRDLRDEAGDAFEGIAVSGLTVVQVDRGGSIDMQLAEMVSGNYFSLQGISAAVGRTLLPEDDVAPGAHAVAVLGHGYWKRAFGGDPAIVGQDLRLSGRPYRIVGIAPESFTGNLRGIVPSFYVSVMMVDELQPDTYSFLEARRSHSLFARGRLRAGVTLAQAGVSAARVAARLRAEKVQGWDPNAEYLLVPSSDVILYPPVDKVIVAGASLLAATVGLVLLVACTNLAGFLLARSLDRRREIALRLALGATRRILIGQLLTETLLLAALAGAAGVSLAAWLLRLLLAADLPVPIPLTFDLGIDLRILVFGILVSVAVGLILGLFPAVQGTRLEVAATLKDESAGSGISRRRLGLRNGLVTAQVAASLVLIVLAGLFLRSLQQARAVDPGFGKEPAAMLTIAVSSKRYSVEEGRVFLRTLLERIGRIPGVTAAGITSNLQLNTLSWSTIDVNVDGYDPPPGQQSHSVNTATVDPGFFAATGIRIVRGRNFDSSDLPDSPPAAIISEAMAKRFWPGEDPVGRILRRSNSPDLTVVGVAADTKVRSFGEDPQPFVYQAYSQDYEVFLTLIARTTGNADRVALHMLAEARKSDPDLWVWEPKTMERYLGTLLVPFRLSALIISALAVIAMALSTVGLYGMISYAVSRRVREVGIRMSLGADSAAITWMLMRYGIRLTTIGACLGLLISLAAMGGLRSLLFGISSFDPVSFGGGILLLATVALLACYLPTRRASGIDPVTALRRE